MSNFGIKNIWKDTNTGTQVDTSNFVTLEGNQTITGAKTFSALPQSSVTPTNANDLTNKAYVDTFVPLSGNQTINGTKTFSALPQSTATPSNNNDLTTKSYVDGRTANGWTTIYTLGNITTLSENFTAIGGYTGMQNSFSVEAQGTYEVLFKCNTDSKDIYASCMLATNAANYDNYGFSGPMFWGGEQVNSVQFAISLKNNQFKILARRPYGTNTNWSVNTRIYVRKVTTGNIQ